MEWLCKGVSVDWDALSVGVAATVFVVDQASKRRDRKAAGRLIARLMIPELRRMEGALNRLHTALKRDWKEGQQAPPAKDRNELIEVSKGLAAPTMERDLADLTVMPRKVTDKVTSLMGWVAHIRDHAFFNGDVPYHLGTEWFGRREFLLDLVNVAKNTCNEALDEARRAGAPSSVIDRWWRWPREQRATRRAGLKGQGAGA